MEPWWSEKMMKKKKFQVHCPRQMKSWRELQSDCPPMIFSAVVVMIDLHYHLA
jgi:hypothetical protein